jgi:flagellar biosynthesis/type III secretory pathway protein FliH
MLHAYRMHEMAIYDFNTSVHVAKREGKEEGREEGREEGIEIGEKRGIEIGEKRGIEIGKIEVQIRMVKSLHDINMSIKDIAKVMKITEQEVYDILNR